MLKSFIKQNIRAVVCLGLVALIILGFIVRLFDWQIIEGSHYRDDVSTTANYKLYSEATRGEILDVNGVALKTNNTLYTITINKLYISEDTSVNEVVENLLKLFDKVGEKWIDLLPIELKSDGAYEFKNTETTEEQKAMSFLRSGDYLGLSVYADANEYMKALIERYELGEIEDKTLARNICSVRFNMERNLFTNTNPYTFAEKVSQKLTAIVSEYSQAMPSVEVQPVSERICLDGTLLPHILGTTGPLTAEEYNEYGDKGYSYDDIIGKFGIEYAMESYLKGEGGVKTVSKDEKGSIISVESVTPAKPGNTVYLTIDSKLQQVANKSLAENVQAAQAQGKKLSAQAGEEGYGEDCTAGAVVMLDVKTFGVLAASTYPTYDINKYNDTEYYISLLEDKNLPLFDRAFQGAFAPGSVVKPAVALAALEEGTISEVTSINCTKTYDYYPSNVVNCMFYHGVLGVTESIIKSCNYYFAEVGRLLGIDTMWLYMEKFGLGEKTGLEISESSGFLAGRDSASWLPGNTVQAAIGQSDNTFTPVQLATYAATIANDGVRLKTHLVSKVTSYDREETILENNEKNAVVVEDLNLTPYNLRIVQNAMRNVVASSSGTAYYSFLDFPIEVAAKTGTAENIGSDHTTFICYAPYDDPEVAIAVVLEHGSSGTFSMAVARDLLESYFGLDVEETTVAVEEVSTAATQ